MKSFTLSSKNIDKVLINLRKLISHEKDIPSKGFILPTCKKILSTRYSGKGRPKGGDYDYVEIDWRKQFGSRNLV